MLWDRFQHVNDALLFVELLQGYFDLCNLIALRSQERSTDTADGGHEVAMEFV